MRARVIKEGIGVACSKSKGWEKRTLITLLRANPKSVIEAPFKFFSVFIKPTEMLFLSAFRFAKTGKFSVFVPSSQFVVNHNSQSA